MNDNQIKELKEDILDEIHAIEETLEHLRFVYGSQAQQYILEPALGTYLMNFYNGIENILKRISKVYYETSPHGQSWHRELLLLAAEPPQGKIPILTHDVVEKLSPYRNFRHRFTSGYGFQLEKEKMEGLVIELNDVWKNVHTHIQNFLEKL